MIVYFTTVVRAAPPEDGGELVKLDWESKRVVARVPIVARNPAVNDPNPRGSTRGGRGILLDGNEVFVASYHTVHVFDTSLHPIRSIRNSLFAGLHELAWHDGSIWATSTCIDAAVKVDKHGEELDSWWPREDPTIAGRFSLSPLEIDKAEDNRVAFVGTSTTTPNHVHINAAAVHEGRPLMLLNRFGCVVKLKPTEVVLEDPTLRGCHNILVRRDGTLVINDTVNAAVRVYDPEGQLLRTVVLKQFAPVRRILRRLWLRRIGVWLGAHGRPYRLFSQLMHPVTIARPLFVRGLCETSRGTVLVGISPAAILEIDLPSGELRDFYSYSPSVNKCIHGLACVS